MAISSATETNSNCPSIYKVAWPRAATCLAYCPVAKRPSAWTSPSHWWSRGQNRVLSFIKPSRRHCCQKTNKEHPCSWKQRNQIKRWALGNRNSFNNSWEILSHLLRSWFSQKWRLRNWPNSLTLATWTETTAKRFFRTWFLKPTITTSGNGTLPKYWGSPLLTSSIVWWEIRLKANFWAWTKKCGTCKGSRKKVGLSWKTHKVTSKSHSKAAGRL